VSTASSETPGQRSSGLAGPGLVSVEPFAAHGLLAALRTTPLRGFDGARPYADATLELAPAFDPELLIPTQRYVLAPRLRHALELRAELLQHGIDPFALQGGAYFCTDANPEERIPLIPPIVEESLEPDGRTVLLVNDGLHRVYAARSLGLPISVVIARGVPRAYPYYAFALPHGWSEVEELEELPDEYQKKEYRIPDNYKSLFREFNSVFPGIQKERKKSNPRHLRA
jgi:hypothetical protein